VTARRFRRSPLTMQSTRSRRASGNCLLDGATSCTAGVRIPRTRRSGRLKRLSCFSRSGGCRWSWSGSKKVSAALIPLSYASWSLTTTQSSASAANVRSWVWPDPRSITGRRRCGHRPCGSWRGSTLSTMMILAAASAEWWTTRLAVVSHQVRQRSSSASRC